MSAYNGSPQVGGITNIPRRAYITTTAFNNDFYTYTTSQNPTTFVTTGVLEANVVGATAATCPANRILRENGKRLYPEGANPGVSTLMVGVYDAITGFKGYIDPNAPPFAVYNTDKSYQTPNGINPNGSLIDQGPPIFTRGPTRLYGGVDVSGGLTVATGALTAPEVILSPVVTLTQSTTNARDLDCSLASYYNIVVNANNNFPLTASNVTSGQIVVVVINSTAAANTPTVTFTTNIRPNNGDVDIAVTSGKAATITFIGLGTTLVELCRIDAIADS
jgi:hypothetical protein